MLAPAKINLYLNVLGKRADNYHLLDTLITFIDIYDEINITSADEFSLEISGDFASFVKNDEHNLVVRAYRLMQQESGINCNIAIKLVKNIPVGAGLGGGSSDAATTLIFLNEIWQLGFSQEKLAEIGLKLGSDVPIFINRHAAFVSGIGEKINNAKNLPKLYAILVYPNKPISTGDIFQSLSLPYSEKTTEKLAHYSTNVVTPEILQNTNIGDDEREWLPFLKSKNNDLESTAIAILPEIRDIIAELSSLNGCEFARMSGSGSSCFAIFTDKHRAEKALTELSIKNTRFWIKLATLY